MIRSSESGYRSKFKGLERDEKNMYEEWLNLKSCIREERIRTVNRYYFGAIT